MHPIINESRFAGRTTIVTGAGSGIGRATAIRFAREGARVIATDVIADRLQEMLSAVSGCDVCLVHGDITDHDIIQRLVTACKGRVDAVANVAGIMDRFLPAAEIDDATWERILAVNLTSVMRLNRAVLPLMVEAGKGAIVNVASEASMRGSCGGLAYTSSKHAIVGLTKSTAFMYGPLGIRVNAVAPGAVNTNIEPTITPGLASSRIVPIFGPMIGHCGSAEPEVIASSITWLASDDATNINGVLLPSDGGWSAI